VPGSTWPDQAVASIAEGQRGLISRRQLGDLGVCRSAIARALARGRLHAIYRGVYAVVPLAVLPPFAREQAAVLTCGDDTFVSHQSAAAIWGIAPLRADDVHVTVVRRQAGRSRDGIRIHRVDALLPRDRRVRDGIPVTSPARTILDLASELAPREVERALDEAIVQRLMTLAALRAVLVQYPARRGCSTLRELIDEGRTTTITRSEAEERMLALVRKAGLPPPEVNAKLGRYTIDFLWRRERVVVEVDGHRYHSNRYALERDHARDAELQARGYLVIRITWRELCNSPELVLARIAQALALRARPA
jgi:very-short-patch-repair endonuclease